MSGLSRNTSRAVLVAGFGLWLASLALPAIEVTGGPQLNGSDVLFRGWSGGRNGVFAWYANPALLIAICLSWLRRDGWASLVSALAVAVALTSLVAAALARGTGFPVPDFSYGLGFYVWLAAQFGVLLAAAGAYAGAKGALHH